MVVAVLVVVEPSQALRLWESLAIVLRQATAATKKPSTLTLQPRVVRVILQQRTCGYRDKLYLRGFFECDRHGSFASKRKLHIV